MITIWNKSTKVIVNQTTNHNLEENFRLKAQGKQLGYHSNPNSAVFPDFGYRLDADGNHVQIDPDVPPVVLSMEEKVANGILTLAELKDGKKSALYAQASHVLNTTKTEEHGYACSDAAQKICVATIAMKNLSDSDEDKLRMTQDGLLYTLPKAREILAKCAAVTASYRASCEAVDRAQNVAQLQAVNLETFL